MYGWIHDLQHRTRRFDWEDLLVFWPILWYVWLVYCFWQLGAWIRHILILNGVKGL